MAMVLAIIPIRTTTMTELPISIRTETVLATTLTTMTTTMVYRIIKTISQMMHPRQLIRMAMGQVTTPIPMMMVMAIPTKWNWPKEPILGMHPALLWIPMAMVFPILWTMTTTMMVFRMWMMRSPQVKNLYWYPLKLLPLMVMATTMLGSFPESTTTPTMW